MPVVDGTALSRRIRAQARLLAAARVTAPHGQLARERSDRARRARADPLTGEALRTVSGHIVAGLRSTDRVCRYGGEEFLVLMP